MVSELFDKYKPILMMNDKEPFFPRSIGCTMFKETKKSPSFNRCIVVEGKTKIVLEYAIYWDYDIQHLYDLEHIWIYLDEKGQVINCEGSFHGKFLKVMLKNRSNIVNGKQVVLYCQPGKHAFAPNPEVFDLLPNYEVCTSTEAGKEGLCITKVCENRVSTNETLNRCVEIYLKKKAFTPSEKYTRYEINTSLFVNWDVLYEKIPRYLETKIMELLEESDTR